MNTKQIEEQLKEKIKAFVSTLRDIKNIPTPIRNMPIIVERLGGTLVENDDGFFTDARIKPTDDGFIMTIPKWPSKETKNSIIAQGIGNLYFCMGYEVNEKLWESYRGREFNQFYDRRDLEMAKIVNEFAAELLMPEEKYREIIDKYSDGERVNIADVAKYFHTPVSITEYRGKILGILRWTQPWCSDREI